MIKVKNIRAGIVIIADAGLKLAPGEMVEMETPTRQVDNAIAHGLLARIDAESETQPNAKSAGRSNAPKAEAKKQSAKAADTEPKPDSNGDPAKSEGVAAGDPGGNAGAEPAAADGAQPEIPGVGQ